MPCIGFYSFPRNCRRPVAKNAIIILALTIACFGKSYAQEFDDSKPEEPKSLYHALFGGVFANAVFHATSRLFGADFAQTSVESIKDNFVSPWVWDSDNFLFNHPGHPYQGGLYHAAARSSGFNFYESMFFDGLGSLTWELFGETDVPSLNDLIVTTTGGVALGEMLHLLYLETENIWAGVFISPMDRITNAVRRTKPSRTNNLYYFSTMTGAGWIQSIKEDRQYIQYLYANDMTLTPSQIYTGNMGCEIIYGDPFVQNSTKPYSQFEMKIQLGSSFYPLWLDWTLLTDGFLLSFNPEHGEKNMLSTGLTMHYDLIAGNNTNFASNALDWSLKWKRLFKTSQLELKLHLGWTFFGSSEYYPFAEFSGMNLELHGADNNFGMGGNGKLFFTFQTQKFGKLTAGACSYMFYNIPLNKADSQGIEFFNLSFLEYSYAFTRNFSIVLNSSLYIKTGRSHRNINVVAIASRVILGVQWTFLEK
jgi:hypothetical protein